MPGQTTPAILVVDDDSGHRTTLRTVLKSWDYAVAEAEDGEKALSLVRKEGFDLILMDVRMAVMSGIDALKQVKAFNPAIPVIIMTAYSSVESAVAAMKAGAYDYLTKPLDFDELKLTIERALEHTRLKSENKSLRDQLETLAGSRTIVAASRQMKELLEMVATISPSEATVLITGASGTGKELIARSVHENSSRRSGPLVSINCAALTESLLESELFGHEKGAFTGADRRREGRFVQANRGSLFLDEVGETSMAMQAKLLRVLQEGEIQRVGGETSVRVDVRVIAATNQNLFQKVEEGGFREDLFYRLNVVNLHVPSLNERTDDIPALAQHFLNLYAQRNRKQTKGFTPRAMDSLLRYRWPGNVRELENVVERAVILSPGEYISEKDLPANIAPGRAAAQEERTGSSRPKEGGSLDAVEKDAVIEALDRAAGNKSEAARLLGITRRTLYNKLEKYGLG
jgi:two-component system response regulator HydG